MNIMGVLKSEDNPKKFTIDMPIWCEPLEVDDFIVSIGKKQSNSIYHVSKVRLKRIPEKRIQKCYIEVYVSNLITMISRNSDQRVLPITWNKRK